MVVGNDYFFVLEEKAIKLFPYTPYKVQRDFVRELSKLLAKNKDGEQALSARIGIFESPTGTGKTTSLLCSALAWLTAPPNGSFLDDSSQSTLFDNEPAWIREARQSVECAPGRESIVKRPKKRQKLQLEEMNASINNLLEMINNNDSDDDKFTRIIRPTHRVYYCSRTHSQLSQVMGELSRIIISTNTNESINAVSLASRKNLCINDAVRKLGSTERISDRCQELLASDECPYFNADKEADMQAYAGQTMQIADIEELVKRGKDMCVCPYYGARERAQMAKVITLPYSMILNKATREALELDLKNSLIIFDEAHNLVDFINEMNSCTIGVIRLETIAGGLRIYLDRFIKRMSPGNTVRLQQLLLLVGRIIERIKDDSFVDVVNVTEFLIQCEVDHINLLPLVEYLKISNLSSKLVSYYEEGSVADVHTLRELEHLLSALSLASADGRLLIERNSGEIKLKYIALNPSAAINDLCEEAHSIILTGGTMSPIDDVLIQLFPKMKVQCHSFRHLIIPENCLGLICANGPSGIPFKFIQSNKDDLALFKELAQLIINVCHIVPNGVVIFFPSFQLLDHFCSVAWNERGKNVKKSLFVESSSLIELDRFLDQYAHACYNEPGALLFAVMGGRLSEGVNFSDRLARALLVVGLPFPNLYNPETQQRAQYFASLHAANGMGQNEFAENICLRSINQTIGRAIRHKDDYAAIILVDQRYQNSKIQSKLSQWFQLSLVNKHNNKTAFGVFFSQIVKFFKSIKLMST